MKFSVLLLVVCCVMACLAERLSHRERILARIRGASTVKSLENQSLSDPEKVNTESPGKSESDSPKPEIKAEKPGRKFEKPVRKIEKPERKVLSEKKVEKPTVQRKAATVSKEPNVGRSITIEARKQSQRERILQRIRNQQTVVTSTTTEPTTKPTTEPTTKPTTEPATEQATEQVTLSGNGLPIDEIEIESSRERVKPLYERPSRTTQAEEVPRITAKISRATTTTTRATTTTTKATTIPAKPTRFSRTTTVKSTVTQNARNPPTSVTASSKLESTQNAKDSPSSTTTSKPVVTSTTSPTTTIKNKPRYLSLPNTNKCQNRPKEFTHKGRHYFYSGHQEELRDRKVDWLESRNICREYCMDSVSMETQDENDVILEFIKKHNITFIWTSGRTCDFAGCEGRGDLLPKIINGWLWTANQFKIPATNKIPEGFSYQPWSKTGAKKKKQPDDAEFQLNGTHESCLAVFNNLFDDGVAWHDVACYHEKPFICEDSDQLLAEELEKEKEKEEEKS